MWLYVVRPNIIGVPRSPTAGCRTRGATTVATRAPALSARQRYSTSSPQMKNSSRGSPIRSTSSRVTSTPLNGITTSSISAVAGGRARRRRCRARRVAPPGSRIGKHQPVRVVLVDDDRAPEVEVARRARAAARGSPASGRPSSSISQTRSAPRSMRQARPSWKPPAPPLLRSRVRATTHRRRRLRGRSSASHSPVPSVEALSTTMTSSSPGARRSRSSSRCSSSQPVEGDHDRDDTSVVLAGGHGVHPRDWRLRCGARPPSSTRVDRHSGSTRESLDQQAEARSSAWLAA